MSEKLLFDYYYGKEAEQFTFYRIPRMLIKDSRFSGLSSDAKILYGLMLDRMALSLQNDWHDEQDRTYIIYTIEQIMEDLNCSKDKAIRVMAELDAKKGIGLIEKKRRGLGKPDLIYVKNFIGVERFVDVEDNTATLDEEKEEKEPSKSHKHTEVLKSDFKKSENQTSRDLKNRLQEVGKSDFKRLEKPTSGGLKNRPQEVLETDSIKNNSNHTDISQNNHINPSIHSRMAEIDPEREKTVMERDVIIKVAIIREMIKENISYTDLLQEHPYEQGKIDEMIEIMAEACVSENKTIRIGKEDKPQVLVQSRFEQYDHETMEYVLSCLADNTTKIHNIRNYLLTALYNAPLTMENYYSAEVNHDLYGGGTKI